MHHRMRRIAEPMLYVDYKHVRDTAEYSETTAPINTYVLTTHNPFRMFQYFQFRLTEIKLFK